MSWTSRKFAWVSVILYKTHKGSLFSDECSRNLVSHTAVVTQHDDKACWSIMAQVMA